MEVHRYKINGQKAFSLIELGIAVFLIGILLVAMVGSDRFIERARRTAAIDITKNSPVLYIDDLALWLDASSEKNFTMDDNTKKVSVWYDLTSKNNDVVQSVSAKQPIFNHDGMNGFSALRFDGTDDVLEKTLMEYYSATTLFIVFKSDGVQGNNDSIFSSVSSVSTTNNDSYQIYYVGTDRLYLAHTDSLGNNTVTAFAPTSGDTENHIISVMLDGISTRKGYFDGELIANTVVDDAQGLLGKHERYRLGLNRNTDSFFEGYIAEVILYNRELYDSEREEIEKYLAKKYNIEIE